MWPVLRPSCPDEKFMIELGTQAGERMSKGGNPCTVRSLPGVVSQPLKGARNLRHRLPQVRPKEKLMDWKKWVGALVVLFAVALLGGVRAGDVKPSVLRAPNSSLVTGYSSLFSSGVAPRELYSFKCSPTDESSAPGSRDIDHKARGARVRARAAIE